MPTNIYSSLWANDNILTFTTDVTYQLYISGNLVYEGQVQKMPEEENVQVNINQICEKYMKMHMDDFRGVEDDVLEHPGAYIHFVVKKRNSSSVLYEVDLLWQWSYEDVWSGNTKYFLSKPINGHGDSRMKMMFTSFNDSQTPIPWIIEWNPYIRVSEDILRFPPDGGEQVVYVYSNDNWSKDNSCHLEDWVSFSPTAGTGFYSAETITEVTVTTDFYTPTISGAESRTQVIDLTTNGSPMEGAPDETHAYITVAQEAPEILSTHWSFLLSPNAETRSVTITSNCA